MRKVWVALSMLGVLVGTAGPVEATPAHPAIEAFNRAFTDVTRRMDTAGALALWEDDGVSLLPGMKPIEGKPALAAFLKRVAAQLPGARVTRQDDQCFDIEVAGNWASEWCSTDQVVQLAANKPPVESWGKMLLVLHRDKASRWRLAREMWNQGVAPGAKKR